MRCNHVYLAPTCSELVPFSLSTGMCVFPASDLFRAARMGVFAQGCATTNPIHFAASFGDRSHRTRGVPEHQNHIVERGYGEWIDESSRSASSHPSAQKTGTKALEKRIAHCVPRPRFSPYIDDAARPFDQRRVWASNHDKRAEGNLIAWLLYSRPS